MLDTPLDLIQATVQLEQPTGTGQRTVGTGFLISEPGPDGAPKTVLITAGHVLADMKAPEARIGYRTADPDGAWRYTPRSLRIRDDAGRPLWTAHPVQDVAAIAIKAPPEFARAAIPIGYLATERDFALNRIAPGDELLILGYPRGMAANPAGFPILRSGRVASYPISPAASPTFLLDFAVFPGNSGGPVFATRGLEAASTASPRPLIAGVLTQQVEMGRERLEIGIVTHARYIAETVDLLEGRPIGSGPVAAADAVPGAKPAAETPVGPLAAALRWLEDRLAAMGDALAGLWRSVVAPTASPPAQGVHRRIA
jgi:V8-like Glu-specific endopeptidase